MRGGKREKTRRCGVQRESERGGKKKEGEWMNKVGGGGGGAGKRENG